MTRDIAVFGAPRTGARDAATRLLTLLPTPRLILTPSRELSVADLPADTTYVPRDGVGPETTPMYRYETILVDDVYAFSQHGILQEVVRAADTRFFVSYQPNDCPLPVQNRLANAANAYTTNPGDAGCATWVADAYDVDAAELMEMPVNDLRELPTDTDEQAGDSAE